MAVKLFSKSDITNGIKFNRFNNFPKVIEYLVIAGGGGASLRGAGAGGYRCSVVGENSGGNSSAESLINVTPTVLYPITVGAGGTGSLTNPTNGSNSVFINIISTGGGGGNGNGGSGGGNGTGIAGQGFNGGADGASSGNFSFGGGGGAGQLGENGNSATNGGDGGNGIASSITGTSVTRAGGGGGGNYNNVTGGVGGNGGGGNAGTSSNKNGVSGTVNTGGGGGSAISSTNVNAGLGTFGAGGSGVVIFRVPTETNVTFSGGVTQTNSVVGSNTVYTVTATSTTSETVTFS